MFSNRLNVELSDEQRRLIDRHRTIEGDIENGIRSWNKRQAKQAEMKRIRNRLVQTGIDRGYVNDLFFNLTE